MSITEANRLNDILKWEQENRYSREVVTVLSGQDLDVGAVIGKITAGTCPTTGTAGTNTGGGTCTGVTAGTKVKAGTYTLKCIGLVSGGGLFSVKDPDGYALPNAVVGSAYTHPQINFTLNDGTPDFAVGDSFTIAVPAGSGKVVAINVDAVNGSADAYGLTAAACDASLADKSGVAIVRDALIIEANLAWPTSPAPTTDQKAAAMGKLKTVGIVPVSQA
jgi:hypothetical protein